MRHLYNRLSGRNLCTVKHPKLTKNVTDTGQSLRMPEFICRGCSKFWDAYYKELIADLLTTRIGQEIAGSRNNKGPFAPF